ncbi:MAG: hypothetical protein PHO56_05505 [Patescibacteria group bacterium]|nr:hypothetical protein [Patescibacteria group bacterium]
MLKNSFIFLIFVLPAILFGQDIPIDDAPGGMSRGVTISDANAKYWLNRFNIYSIRIDSASRAETSIDINLLYQIYWKGSGDTAKHVAENGVAAALAAYLQRGTMVISPRDRQFAIFTIMYVALCDPLHTPPENYLWLLKDNEMRQAEAHRNILRVLAKKSDSLFVATLCDIILAPQNYPGKNLSILEYVFWGSTKNAAVVPLTNIAAEFLKPLTEARVPAILLDKYRLARYTAFNEPVAVRDRTVFALFRHTDAPIYFDVLGRKITSAKISGKLRPIRQAGPNIKIVF